MSTKEKIVFIKERFSAEIRLISTALILIFAFLAFFNINGTLGWFSSNDEVSASGMNVSIRDIKDFTVELKSYSVDSVSGADYSVSDNESYVLPTLDPSGIVYNQYERALVVMITITALNDANASLSLKTIHNELSYEQENFISNCIKVSSATINGNLATRSSDTQSFVSITNGVASKDSSLTILDEFQMNKGDELTLCFILEYNESAIAALFEGARGEGNNFDQMSFTNDLAFVVERAD